jgi:hypothetical protein
VIIGVDPHKLSVTIEARDSREILRAKGRFGTDTRSYRQLLAYARQWPERVQAVEGANGIGRPLAHGRAAGQATAGADDRSRADGAAAAVRSP